MDTILEAFQTIGIDFGVFWKSVLVLLAGTLALSLFGRFIFGKRSALNIAVSSAIGIIFIYGATVIIGSLGPDLEQFVAPLPFVTIQNQQMILFSFTDAHYTTICAEVLGMIILAFLVNLADQWLPDGKNFFGWIFFRCLTVVIGYLMHLVITWVFTAILPAGIITYAPTVLLGLLILLLLTGALKLVVGAVISSVNPIIGGLYSFFFANVIGKQLTKAMLTTLILALLVWLLRYVGLGVISFAGAALSAYIPVLLLLIALWYLVMKVL